MKKIILDGTMLNVDDLNLIANNQAILEVDENVFIRLEKKRKEFLKKFDVSKVMKDYGASYVELDWSSKKISTLDVRSVMVVLLNSLINSNVGISRKTVEILENMINYKITPVLDENKSNHDNLCALCLAMNGVGKVNYENDIVDAKEAFRKSRLQILELDSIDTYSIQNSSVFDIALVSILVKNSKDFLETIDLISAISLEGLNGNVTPLDESIYKHRPFEENLVVAKNMNNILKGSYIYTSEKIALQDPLSYRDITHIHGSARHILNNLEKKVCMGLNYVPHIIIDKDGYYSTTNDSIAWTINVEMLGQIFSHMSKSSVFRTIKLSDTRFTGLNRYLSPDNEVHAFAIVPNCVSGLDAEIRHLANPSNSDFFSYKSKYDDYDCNSRQVTMKVNEILEKLAYVFGVELMCSCQAIDLRDNIKLGERTSIVYDKVRDVLPFYDADRNLTSDIEKMYSLVKSKILIKEVC
ncbi:MAG: aromatic amino acid lyase [Bacilli bacterium]